MDTLIVKVKNSYDSSYISGAKVAIDIISPSGANPSHRESRTDSSGAHFRFDSYSGPSLINITVTYEGVTVRVRKQIIEWTNDTDLNARTASLELLLDYKPTTTTEDLTINVATLLESTHNAMDSHQKEILYLSQL